MSYFITKHANKRRQQRGFRSADLANLFSLADLDVPVSKGACAIRMSRSALAEALADGLRPAAAERLTRGVMVLADDGAVVTMAHLHGRKSKSYTRRDRRPFWK